MATSKARTVEQYLAELPAERREVVAAARDLVNRHLPAGFVESMNFGMIAWEIPLARYPATYNKQPLMFVALAAQKNGYSLYLCSPGGDAPAVAALKAAYVAAGKKLDMGKGCVRFQRIGDLLPDAIGTMIARMSVEEYLARYEASRST